MWLERVLLLQHDNALRRLTWTLPLRPARKIFVLVKPSIRVLNIDLGRTVPLVAVPSFLVRREVVGTGSNCWKSITLVNDFSTALSDIVSQLRSSPAVWEA
jgi:hypothetical protein